MSMGSCSSPVITSEKFLISLHHAPSEHWRIDAFELQCWTGLLKVPCTARRSNQSVFREINPEYSLDGLMLKQKLQYFGLLIRTADSLEKSLVLGKIEGRRRRGHQRVRWLMASPMQWTWTWANSGRWWGTGRPGVQPSMGSQRVRNHWATEQRQWCPLSQETGDVIHNTVVFLYCSSPHLQSWECSIHSLPLNWELSCSQEDGDWAWFCWPVSLPCVLSDPRFFFSSLTGRQHLLWDFSLSTFSLPQLQFLCLFKKIPLFPLLLIFSLCSKFSVISSSWLGGFRLEGRDRKARDPLSGLGCLKHLEINQTP